MLPLLRRRRTWALLASVAVLGRAEPLSSDALPSPLGEFDRPSCEDLNRKRNIQAKRRKHLTRAVLCDTAPAACVTEMLFAHELYWSEAEARSYGGAKCAQWTHDEDWPTHEPFLKRPLGLGGIWETLLQLLPNQTMWLHGDSITTQLCEAAFCSLARSHVVPQPALCTVGARHPLTPPCHDIDALARASGMQMRAALLPNGARLVCSAVGVLEREKIAMVLDRLPSISVAIFNYGLHYHSKENFVAMLDTLFGLLSTWAKAKPGRVPLYRENSAQHFKGGSWTPGAHKPPPGTACNCEPLAARDAMSNLERVAANQNIVFNEIARAKAAASGAVAVVPFFNLTAPRFNMHRRHFCSFSNQLKIGSCCDCTHLCYTPLFWDTFFVSLRDAIVLHPHFEALRQEGGAHAVEDDVIDAVAGTEPMVGGFTHPRRSRRRGPRAWRRRGGDTL